MNNHLSIIVSGKPKGKQRARKGGGHWYNPQKSDMAIIKRIIEQQLPEDFIRIPKGVPVIVNWTIFFEPAKSQKTKKFLDLIKDDMYPYIKKPDRDNADKLILDCMSKIVFYDDNQAYGGEIYKYYSTNPRTEIEVKW